ncbi:hypothetical protein WA158_007223 [Blastocystis sp. Blastoise]
MSEETTSRPLSPSMQIKLDTDNTRWQLYVNKQLPLDYEFVLDHELKHQCEKKALELLLLANPKGDFAWHLLSKHSSYATYINMENDYSSHLGLGLIRCPIAFVNSVASGDALSGKLFSIPYSSNQIVRLSDCLTIDLLCFDYPWPLKPRSYLVYTYIKYLNDNTLIRVSWDCEEKLQQYYPPLPDTVRGYIKVAGYIARKTANDNLTAFAHITRMNPNGNLPKILDRSSAENEIEIIKTLVHTVERVYKKTMTQQTESINNQNTNMTKEVSSV